ncbi:hypothetical protein RvY_19001 [Ramazzottius varieornatus]|uniref:Golgi apparatus membrane protein TVP23 homolog n=1 Tax=Ramazzottius varieornatus TaxID=947166 RepID=A0A1D1WBZ0_RAMVA|nr:hypothetical protein RvY_19001 [Ramazzottius varieornatus]
MSSYEFGVGDDRLNAQGNQAQARFHQPGIVLVHLLFRTAGFGTYLLCSLILSSFVTSFVVVVFLLSIDFWVVKNITGRKLVGLRWWNYVDEEGKNKWMYESRKPEEQKLISSKESKIFWSSLIFFQILWLIMAFATILHISWLVLACIANFFNGANLWGYFRCRYNRKDAQNAAMKYIAPQMMRNAWGGITSKFTRKPNTEDDYRTLAEER